MNAPSIIAALSDPGAYPHAVDVVEVRQTHISMVFLAGPFAYKVKKAVDLGYLDYSSLGKRRHFCDEEIRLNRRLAPTVYRDVVPLVAHGTGLRVGGPGEAVEWAVRMERLPDEATLERGLLDNRIDAATIDQLARRLAQFHAQAARGPHIAAFGRFEVIARNARENFEQSADHIGRTVSAEVYRRVGCRTEAELAALRPLVEARAEAGVPCDTHGDLRLEHIYCFRERTPPADLVIVDCIEFNERFRYADPFADLAFLVMDLAFHGHAEWGRKLVEAYLAAANDRVGAALLPFYTAYRAVVRAKVEGVKSVEPEVPAAERATAQRRARAYWMLALQQLEPAAARPCLVLVCGLPGSGKSTLAGGLAASAGFRVIRSDVVRKELAGLQPTASARAAADTGLYARDWTDRTYAECLVRAEAGIERGERVIVDASFGEDRRRRVFVELADRWHVPVVILECHAAPEVARARLDARRGDASDADWTIHTLLAERWEPARPGDVPMHRLATTTLGAGATLEAALAVLRAGGVAR